MDAARRDYRTAARQRDINDTIPLAWEAILSEPDGLLVDLLAERTEDICGFRPDLDRCVEFVEQIRQGLMPSPKPLPVERVMHRKEELSGTARAKEPDTSASQGSSEQIGWTYDGQFHVAGSAKEVLCTVLAKLHEEDPTFFDRFTSRKHGRRRRYAASERSDLYPGRPDLAEEFSVEVARGWWVGTNYSRRDIGKIIDLALDVVGIEIARKYSVKIG